MVSVLRFKPAEINIINQAKERNQIQNKLTFKDNVATIKINGRTCNFRIVTKNPNADFSALDEKAWKLVQNKILLMLSRKRLFGNNLPFVKKVDQKGWHLSKEIKGEKILTHDAKRKNHRTHKDFNELKNYLNGLLFKKENKIAEVAQQVQEVQEQAAPVVLFEHPVVPVKPKATCKKQRIILPTVPIPQQIDNMNWLYKMLREFATQQQRKRKAIQQESVEQKWPANTPAEQKQEVKNSIPAIEAGPIVLFRQPIASVQPRPIRLNARCGNQRIILPTNPQFTCQLSQVHVAFIFGFFKYLLTKHEERRSIQYQQTITPIKVAATKLKNQRVVLPTLRMPQQIKNMDMDWLYKMFNDFATQQQRERRVLKQKPTALIALEAPSEHKNEVRNSIPARVELVEEEDQEIENEPRPQPAPIIIHRHVTYINNYNLPANNCNMHTVILIMGLIVGAFYLVHKYCAPQFDENYRTFYGI